LRRRGIAGTPRARVVIFTSIRIGVVITTVLVAVMVGIGVRGRGAVVAGAVVVAGRICTGGLVAVATAVIVFGHFVKWLKDFEGCRLEMDGLELKCGGKVGGGGGHSLNPVGS
jgi:hypothetical protein